MSVKSERKKAIKAQKQIQEAAVPIVDFNLSNETFFPDGFLIRVLDAAAKEVSAQIKKVHAYVSNEDATHQHDGTELCLVVPWKNGDALKAATELFRRAVLGCSFIHSVQKGSNDGHADVCNDCLNAIVTDKKYEALIQLISAAYQAHFPDWLEQILKTVDKSYTSFREAWDEPEGVVSLFYNDGDLAIGITRGGFQPYFRARLHSRHGKGKPVGRDDFKTVLPVNQSLAELVDPNHIGHFVQMMYEAHSDSPRYDKSSLNGNHCRDVSDEEATRASLQHLEKKPAAVAAG